jgi:hypothetical protein
MVGPANEILVLFPNRRHVWANPVGKPSAMRVFLHRTELQLFNGFLELIKD